MCSAPQQVSSPTSSTSQPFSVRTRTVASLTSANSWSARQPVNSATRFLRSPRAGKTTAPRSLRGPRCRARNELSGTCGACAAAAASRPGSSLRRPSQAPTAVSPSTCCSHSSLNTSHCAAREGSSTENTNQRTSRPTTDWGRPGCSTVRVFSRIRPYSTPEGQAVSQARQSRHWSRCLSTVGVGAILSWRMPFIR
jgi:hypothetical protein